MTSWMAGQRQEEHDSLLQSTHPMSHPHFIKKCIKINILQNLFGNKAFRIESFQLTLGHCSHAG